MMPMAEEWIVRVEGKEYGPVDLHELRQWKEEGRLIRENEVRAPESEQWIRAGELPEIFADPIAEPNAPTSPASQATVSAILTQSWLIYRQGLVQFLGLSALVIVPSVCVQLSSAAIGSDSDVALDLRTALAGLFNLGMLVLSLIAWPIYIAGLQILTHELKEERPCTLRETVSRALKFWPRVAGLCILVYGAFVLLLALAFAILLMVATGASSPFVLLCSLGLLAFQVWMFGRVFAAVLFWQQTAVLEDADAMEALRRSNALAHSRRELPRLRRPLWRGAILASIWCAFATALSIGPEWSALTEYFNALRTSQDPQAILQAMTAHSTARGVRTVPLLLGVLQAVLRPLLGIAFVLLYFDTTGDRRGQKDS